MLLFSLVINVFLGPIQETGLTPTKDLRSLDPHLFLKGDTIAWNVVLVCITLFKCLSDISEGDIDYLGHSKPSWKIESRRLFKCSQCDTIMEFPQSVQSSRTSYSITSEVLYHCSPWIQFSMPLWSKCNISLTPYCGICTSAIYHTRISSQQILLRFRKLVRRYFFS